MANMKTRPAHLNCIRGRPPLWLSFEGPRWLRSRPLGTAVRAGRVAGIILSSAAFERALSQGEYDRRIRELAADGNPPPAIYESLVVQSAREAADLLSALHSSTAGRQGHVSMGFAPELCYDTEGLIEEAEYLWVAVRRPNLVIQIPATREGVAAAGQLLLGGIGVNLIHIVSLSRYLDAGTTYVDALAARETRGLSLPGIACAATLDPYGSVGEAGWHAIHSASFEIFGKEQFRHLAESGALPQILLRPAGSAEFAAEEDPVCGAGEVLVEVIAPAAHASGPAPEFPFAEDETLDELQSESIKQELLCSDRALAIIAAKRCHTAARSARTSPGQAASHRSG